CPNICHRPKEERDVAVLWRIIVADQFDDPLGQLRGIKLSRVLFGFLNAFGARAFSRRDHQLNQRLRINLFTLGLALLVRNIAELIKLTRRDFLQRREQSLKKMIEEMDQRWLTAKVQQQWQLDPARRDQRFSHCSKDIDVSAPKAINRLLAIADDEKIRAFSTPFLQG